VSLVPQVAHVSRAAAARRVSGKLPPGIFRQLRCAAAPSGVLSAHGVTSYAREVVGKHSNQFIARSLTRSGWEAG
jgi:hypothetical protein